MDAIILAAGMGTRLRPLTTHLPKPMVPIFDKPLFLRQVESLAAQGVQWIAANAWHAADVLCDYSESLGCEFGGRTCNVSVFPDNEQLLGTGGGIRHLAPKLNNTSEFLVLNGDVLFECDISAALKTHHAHNADLTLVVVERPDLPRTLHKVAWDDSGLIRSIDGVPDGTSHTHHGIYTGTLIGTPALLNALPTHGPSCLKQDGFWPMLKRGYRIAAHVSEGYWCDIGTPESYLNAHFDVMNNASALSHWWSGENHTMRTTSWNDSSICTKNPQAIILADGITLIPPYFLGKAVNIAANAVIGPWAVIGSGATVAPSVTISHSLVWPTTIVTQSTDNSILCPDYRLVLSDATRERQRGFRL